jgi:hypothetical protein
MRQVESCLLETLLIGSTSGCLPAFEDKETCFFYRGKTASVEMEKCNGRLKVFQPGQESPFYDSSDLGSCVDLEHSWNLSYEVSNEIQREISRMRRQQRETPVTQH